MNKKEIAILFGLILSFAISFVVDVDKRAEASRSSILRMHVIAADDSEEAQQIKEIVKDKLYSVCAELYRDASSFEEALNIAKENTDYIQQVADAVLLQNGADYKSACNIETYYFGSAQYKNTTVPRGDYAVLFVRLGQADGKNWWGILYPDLALSACAKEDDTTDNALWTNDDVQVKLKVVELWQDIKHSLSKSEKYDRM